MPPLLLQPLVENAVKHGIQDCLAGGVIRIDARREGTSLRVAVENPVDPDAPSRVGEGVGLQNVRRRLEVFGAREARLSAQRSGDVFRVTLTLPAIGGGVYPFSSSPAERPAPSNTRSVIIKIAIIPRIT